MTLPEPFHVCFLTGEYPPMRGGVGDYTSLVARSLAAQGVRCSVVTSRAAGGAVARPGPLEPSVYPALADWGWSAWSHLVRLIDDLQPDVLHVQYQTGAFGMKPALNLLPLRLRLSGNRVPIALTYHDLKTPYLFPKAGPVRSLANAALQSAASAVIVTNFEDLGQVVRPRALREPPPWRDRSGRRKVDLIPIGSNIAPVELSETEREAIRARLGLAQNELAIGYFGFVDPWKGVGRLIDAVASLRQQGRAVRLVFVGGARGKGLEPATEYEREVRVRLDASGVARATIWTGYGSPEQTSLYLQALDCCALPFAAGGCYRHGTLAAAIAHALPIVTTRPESHDPPAAAGPRSRERAAEAGLPELGLPRLEHGRNALLVARGDDPAELAAALAALADSTELRARLRRGAAELAPWFTWDRIARSSVGVYERLLGLAEAPRPLDRVG